MFEDEMEEKEEWAFKKVKIRYNMRKKGNGKITRNFFQFSL